MALVGHISGSSQSNSVIGVSGSVIVANRPNSLFPGFPGGDTSFYVSGSINDNDKSVFGGDVVISGSLKVAGATVGDVVGPAGGVIDSEIVVFDGTTGKLIKGASQKAIVNSQGDITGSVLSSSAGTLTTTSTTASVFTTNATTGNLFSAATTFNAATSAGGATTVAIGTTNAGSTVSLRGNTTVVGTDLSSSTGTFNLLPTTTNVQFGNAAGSVTVLGDVAVNGGDITTTAGTFNLINTTATSLNIGGAGTSITLGGSTATKTVNLGTGGNAASTTTVQLGSSTAGATNTVNIGAVSTAGTTTVFSPAVNLGVTASGTTTINSPTVNIGTATGATTVKSNLTVDKNAIITGDLTVNGTTTTVDSTNVTIKDSLIGLGFSSGSVSVTSGDRGFIGGLTGGNNVGVVWKNTPSEFATLYTADSAASSSITVASYANFHAANIQGDIVSASLGFSGSHTALIDGSSAFIAGTGIQITSQSNGAVTITNSSPASSIAQYFSSTTNGALFTTGSTAFIGSESGVDAPVDKGSDVFFYVSGSLDGANKSLFGGNVVISGSLDVKNGAAFSGNLLQMTGSIEATLGFSGSLTQLTDGSSYLIAGTGIQITSQSNGPVTITNSSPASSIAQYFSSTTAGALYTTGSTAFIGNEVGIDAPSDKGSDIFFYVSGSKDGTNKSLFGGGVVISGSLDVQGGAITSAASSTFDVLNDVTTTLTVGSTALTASFGGALGALVNIGTDADDVNVGGPTNGNVIIGNINNTGGTTTIRTAYTIVKSGLTTVSGSIILGDNSSDKISVSGSVDTDVLPAVDATYNLGSPSYRWANVYTGDLHLRNDRGNWTMIEEENYLTIRNNNTGKVFRLLMEEVLTK